MSSDMQIEWVPTESLKPNAKNRNRHPKEQIERLAKIIKANGWRHPIIVSKLSGQVVVGHGRLEAAKLLNEPKVPVHFQDFANETEEYQFGIADNAIASWAELDLAGINTDLPAFGPELDVDLLGIKDFELEPADKYGDKDADATPEVRETSIRMGDLFSLGEHRLLCGDSTQLEQVLRLMNGEKADMVFTDPPYIGMVGAKWDKNDLNWEAVYSNLDTACAEESSIVITGQTPIIFKWFPILSHKFQFIQDMVWVKQRAVNLTHSIFARRHENILWFAKGKKYFDSEKSRTETDIERVNKWSASKKVKGRDGGLAGGKETVSGYSAQSVLEFGRVYHHHEEYEGHPTQKPTELITYLMNSLSKANSIVLDPFLGSGSTLIACEKTNRKCYGSEIDPLYCDVIVRRWMKFTGQMAYLIEDANGKLPNGPVPFADLSSMRSTTPIEESKNTAQKNVGQKEGIIVRKNAKAAGKSD